MIAHSEGTDRAADPYRCVFGYSHVIQDLSDHPAVTGEWKGASLASLGGAYVNLFSTAAGRYQIVKATWVACKEILCLPDFTAPSQDEAALLLIRDKGALDLVNAGDIEGVIQRCRGVWASLPGNAAGQPQKTLAELISAYTAAGGALA